MRELYKYVSTTETILASDGDILVIKIIYKFSIHFNGTLPEQKIIDITKEDFFKKLRKYFSLYLCL